MIVTTNGIQGAIGRSNENNKRKQSRWLKPTPLFASVFAYANAESDKRRTPVVNINRWKARKKERKIQLKKQYEYEEKCLS